MRVFCCIEQNGNNSKFLFSCRTCQCKGPFTLSEGEWKCESDVPFSLMVDVTYVNSYIEKM